jgi:hypothetical protein
MTRRVSIPRVSGGPARTVDTTLGQMSVDYGAAINRALELTEKRAAIDKYGDLVASGHEQTLWGFARSGVSVASTTYNLVPGNDTAVPETWIADGDGSVLSVSASLDTAAGEALSFRVQINGASPSVATVSIPAGETTFVYTWDKDKVQFAKGDAVRLVVVTPSVWTITVAITASVKVEV